MDAKIYANYMIYIMDDAFDDLTNMKLNKLLFFAQGHFLNKYGKPLFSDRIEAWEHGPVIPDVYSKYKAYGDSPISDYDPETIVLVSPEAEEILYGVARKYGKYTASALRNMTHAVGTPWDLVYRRGQKHKEIPLALIEDYFSELENLKPAEKQFRKADFIGYRDEDGILVLPRDWDDEEV